jgi:hypothetical protein
MRLEGHPMKMINRLVVAAAFTILSSALTGSALAQATEGSVAEGRHHTTSAYIAHTRDHLRLLQHHAVAHALTATLVDRDLVRAYIVAARTDLTLAESKHREFDTSLTSVERTANQAMLDATRAAYVEASAAILTLEREMNRADWRAQVLSEEASRAFHAMRRADEAHQALGRVIAVHDAAAPPAPPAVAQAAVRRSR